MPENNQIQQLLAALPEMFPGTQNIPLKNIRPNPDNPGAPITEEQIKELAQNIQARGLLNHIRVNPDRANLLAPGAQPHPDNFRTKADGQPWELGDFNFIVLTGENRYRAALWLKWETIPGQILNPTAKEAVILNHLDNDVRERGWWASYQSIEQLIQADPNLTQREIGVLLKLPLPKVNRALGLLPLLNPEARVLIVTVSNNSNKGNKGFSELAAAKLADLGPGMGLKPGVKKKDPIDATSGGLYPYPAIPPETQDLVYRTLVTACDHQMTEAQVGKLVEKVQAGNSPEALDKTAPTVPSHPVAHPTHHSGERQPEKPDSHPTAVHSHPAHTLSPAAPAEPESQPEKPSIFWQWMLGIKFFSQLKSKYKKGEPLTLNEKILVGLYRLYDWMLKPIGKRLGRFFKWAGKGIWESLKKAFGKVFGKTVEVVLPWLLVALLVWGFLAFFHFVVISPWHWVEHKIGSMFHHEDITQPTPVPTPSPITSSILPKVEAAVVHLAPKKKVEQTAPTSARVVTYQPAISFQTTALTLNHTSTLYDPKILELEIKSLSQNCIVKDYPLTPDEGMPGDVAVSRIQDITDTDKYTMMIGGGKQIIQSVNPTNTTLTINYKSADPFGGFLDGNGKMNFLWEDVKYIHANEIDVETKNPSVIYQCSLVVSGSKYPLTLQCATTADLEHLVSTMQYFIRSSRLGHDTALAGMPYPTQGLSLNNDRLVDKLWANSPADKVGLQLGDHLWSVGKITSDQQEKKVLEAGLQSVPATLFIASDPDWNKAVTAKNFGITPYLHPMLKKVVLSI